MAAVRSIARRLGPLLPLLLVSLVPRLGVSELVVTVFYIVMSYVSTGHDYGYDYFEAHPDEFWNNATTTTNWVCSLLSECEPAELMIKYE
jgi:hypothetical protein